LPHEPIIDVSAAVERQRLSAFLVRLLALSLIVAFCDGFDQNVISFAAPAIAQELGLSPAMMGNVFSAGLAGGMLGGFLFGALGDRLGRRLRRFRTRGAQVPLEDRLLRQEYDVGRGGSGRPRADDAGTNNHACGRLLTHKTASFGTRSLLLHGIVSSPFELIHTALH
jgi:Major Facilitator Superfamily